MRLRAAVCATIAALVAVAALTAPTATPAATDRVEGHGVQWWHQRAVQNRRTINRMRRTTRRVLQSAPFVNHWLDGAFLCVHAGEGSWSSRTGNGYYGGLQMDIPFQRAYGSEFLRAFGTADRWPVSVQIAVAIRAWLSRGFGPWPNTARECGLL